MIRGKRVLGIIPARGGSKRLPLKNIKPLAGKPLIAWTIDEANKCNYIDHLIVSTDHYPTAVIVEHHDCDWLPRPKELAADDANVLDAVWDVLAELPHFDYVVLLQPTSPLRLIEDIEGTLRLAAPACMSVTRGSDKPNGAVYASEIEHLRQFSHFDKACSIRYEMPPERSVDINTQEDFDEAERLLSP